MSEAFFVLLAFLLLGLSVKKNDFFFFSVCLLFFFLAAFRGLEVGTDVLNYKEQFEFISQNGWLPIEPLWLGLNQFVSYMGLGYRGVLFLSSLLVLLPVFYTIYKESKNPILSLFFYYTLYFYLQSFNIIRQSIAASLLLLGFVFLKQQNKMMYALFVLVAGLFHYSAFLGFIVLIVDSIPTKKGIYISVMVFSLFVGLWLPEKIFELGTTVFPYKSYIRMDFGNFIGNALYQLILISFFIYVMWIVKSKENIYFKIFFISIVISNLVSRVPLGNRVLILFGIIQILFLPKLIYDNKVREKALVAIIIMLYAFILFLRHFGYGEVFPYENILL